MSKQQSAAAALSILQKYGARAPSERLTDEELRIYSDGLVADAKECLGDEARTLIAKLRGLRLKGCRIARAPKVHVDPGALSRLPRT